MWVEVGDRAGRKREEPSDALQVKRHGKSPGLRESARGFTQPRKHLYADHCKTWKARLRAIQRKPRAITEIHFIHDLASYIVARTLAVSSTS